MTPEILSRKGARKRAVDRYFTGMPCTKGHVDQRYVRNGTCIACQQDFNNDARRKAREKRGIVA